VVPIILLPVEGFILQIVKNLQVFDDANLEF